MKVAVIGAGAAGTACAWAARRGGAVVSVVYDRPGLSALYSGALDSVAWEVANAPVALDHEVLAFATQVDAWTVGSAGCRVVSGSGLLRPARAIDSALLDVESLAGRTIAVADVRRAGWDAPALARALSADSWARRTKTSFAAVSVGVDVERWEQSLGDFDFAALHDDRDRLGALGDALRAATTTSSSVDAWLVGAWLGVQPGTADDLRAQLDVPVGEVLSELGGPAGGRFQVARDRLLEDAGASTLRHRVVAVDRDADGWSVRMEGDAAAPLHADAVVLAIGGVASGGLELVGPSRARPASASFAASLDAQVRFELDGEDVDAPSTLHGFDLEHAGLDALERVGIACDGVRVRGTEGLFAAGDAVAGRERTVLEAVRAGIAAGRAALSG